MFLSLIKSVASHSPAALFAASLSLIPAITPAQNQPAVPPFPAIDAPEQDWKNWFADYYFYLLQTGDLEANTNDNIDIRNGNWSFTKDWKGDAKGAVVPAGGYSALEFKSYVWALPTVPAAPDDVIIMLEAKALERWNTYAAQKFPLNGSVEWKFSYMGHENTRGIAQLEAWYQYVAYARAYNDECGVYVANLGGYSDGVGADMEWQLEMNAETSSAALPVSISLSPPGGGPGVTITLSQSMNGMNYNNDDDHRPIATKQVQSYPSINLPGVVTVRKEANTEGFAKLHSFTGWAGPGNAEMFFECWFSGIFDEIVIPQGN